MGQAVEKERLIGLLEPAVAAMGFELADIDLYLGRRGVLRLYIDRAGGVTVELRGGVYELPRPFELTAADSGVWLPVTPLTMGATLKVYGVPLVRPVTVHCSAPRVVQLPPGEPVTE